MRYGIKNRDEAIGTEVDAFRRSITRLFDNYMNLEPTGFLDSSWDPAVDVAEDSQNVYLTADLPGMDEKDLEISFEKNMITISGEKKTAARQENRDKRRIFSERSCGRFRRSIHLPVKVQSDGITAEYQKGVLHITIPKASAVKDEKIRIQIK